MTNENYTNMSNEELLDEISKIKIPNNKIGNFVKRHYTQMYGEIVGRTCFLEDDISFMARLYCLEHGITSHPICHKKDCSNPTKWNRETRQFRTYCCESCRSSDEDWQMKVENTNLTRHGDRHPCKLDKFKEKSKLTWMTNLGVDNPQKSKVVNQKTRNTNIERYDGPAPACSKEVRDKMQSTCVERYLVENPFQLLTPKTEQSDETREKIHNTWNGKSNDEIANIVEKREKVCLERHGVINPFQVPEYKIKSKETCRVRYGTDYYSQSIEYHKNKKHKFHSEKYPGLTFDSTWEVKVYEFCKNNNIPIEYSPEISIPYEYDGRTWTYHPDFLINGKVYEVKGDNFFRINESTGQEEMFCPYRDEDWSDEKYDWMCGLYEAKHQCMMNKGVVIIRGSDIKDIENAKSGRTITFLQTSDHNQ